MSLPNVLSPLRAAFATLITLLGCISYSGSASTEPLRIYTDREPHRLAPVLRAFIASTGRPTRIEHHPTELLQAIAARREDAPVALMLTAGLAPLADAKAGGLTVPTRSPAIEAAVPAPFRDPDGHWIGLSSYARVAFVARDRVAVDTLTYAGLADPIWRGRLCMRSGFHPYNLELVGGYLVRHGREATRTWLEQLKSNLAHNPTGNDRGQAQAIAEGRCDVALVNTYYWSEMAGADGQQRAWATATRMVFPDTDGHGSHVTISGAAVLKGRGDAAPAVELLTYMTSPVGQQIYAVMQAAFPISPAVTASPLAGGGAALNPAQTSLSKVAASLAEARQLLELVDFDGAKPLASKAQP